MNIFLASTADLYAEHRRTQSRRKKEKIANELQRRHDEHYSRPGHGNDWFTYQGSKFGWVNIPRFDFRLLP
jgi:hypothetical protein